MKKQLALAIALAAASFGSIDGELSYSWVDGGYSRTNLDFSGTDVDFDGFALRSSAELGQSFYVLGGYLSASNDDFGTDIDLNQSQIGFGFHHRLSEGVRADFIAEVSYLNAEAEVGGFSDDEEAYRGSIGVRGQMAENFEGLIKLNYSDAGDAQDGDVSGTVGAQFKFNPTWGLVGEVELGDDVTQYLLGVRASF